MSTLYNRIAGRSVERLAALSDGIFAVAMTLLVLDLRVPAASTVHSEREILNALIALAPQLVMYGMSFLTLGIFWVGQQTQLNHLARSDRRLAWIHIAFLSAISLMPFSTRLLAEFITFRVALIVYWSNIAALGALLFVSWSHAQAARLIPDELPEPVSLAIRRRIIQAQMLYALGMSLCLISTWISIGFMVIVQLNYAIAPRFALRHEPEPSPHQSG